MHSPFSSWYQKIEYPTPYGCKYEYLKKEEQENIPLISVHLKNKNKIRMKKRWSQVYTYILSLDYFSSSLLSCMYVLYIVYVCMYVCMLACQL